MKSNIPIRYQKKHVIMTYILHLDPALKLKRLRINRLIKNRIRNPGCLSTQIQRGGGPGGLCKRGNIGPNMIFCQRANSPLFLQDGTQALVL